MSNPERINRRRKGAPSARQQRGLTLVELLVGMLIGLMVIGAAIATLILTRSSAGSVSDLSQLQQQGSYALRVIGLQVRQAGSVDIVTTPGTQAVEFDKRFDGFAGANAPVAGIEGANGAPDTLSFSNQAASLLTKTQARDCLGNESNLPNGRIDSTFSVSRSGGLQCLGSQTVQPLIANVSDFQVWYRVISADGNAVRRLNADEVRAGALWNSVRAVEVCLDLHGTESGIAESGRYINCHDQDAPRNGQRHLVFTNVFDLRTQGG